MMLTQNNLNIVLDNSNALDWFNEELTDAVLDRIEGKKHRDLSGVLRDYAYDFYQLGRIRGIQSERRRRKRGIGMNEKINALADRLDTLTGELDMVNDMLTVTWHAADDGEITGTVIANAIGATRAHLERLMDDYMTVCTELLTLSREAGREDSKQTKSEGD